MPAAINRIGIRRRTFAQLRPLFAFVPEGERTQLLAMLRELSPEARADLAAHGGRVHAMGCDLAVEKARVALLETQQQRQELANAVAGTSAGTTGLPQLVGLLDVVADTAAETKHAVADIINVMLEELVHHRYELPAFSTLDRMAFRAREKSNNQHFSAIAGQLTSQTKALIDGLLKTVTGESTSPWQMLKREPKRPTNKETRTYIQHIRRLQYLVEQLPKPDVPVPKLMQFRHLARALDAAEMAELKPQKRYALAVIFIRAQHAQSLDDAADLFIRLMQNLENNARQKLLSFQQERVHKTDMLVGQLKDILGAYQLDGTDTQRVEAISTTLVAEVDECLEAAERIAAFCRAA